MSNSLDPDQARRFVGPDVGPKCLPRSSADDTGRQSVNILSLSILQIIQTVYFGLSVVNDIFGGNVRPSQGQSKRGLQKFLDNFLASIVYPVGVVRE